MQGIYHGQSGPPLGFGNIFFYGDLHDIVLPRRTLRECLAEELRRLDPDVLYGRVITEGWALIGPPEQSGAASSAASKS